MMQTTLRSMNDAAQRFCFRSLTPDSFAITFGQSSRQELREL